MSQVIISGLESRSKLKGGVDALANAVKSTLGPRGRNVLIQQDFDGPKVTKDGVTVARAIHLEDPVEEMGAQLLVKVAKATNDAAGDGTTTATVLAQAIYNESLKLIASGADTNHLRKGMEIAANEVVAYLKEHHIDIASDLDKIERVATVSANNNTYIGGIIRQAVEAVGSEGIITINESKSTETYVETSNGFEFDRGYLSPYFVTNQDTMKVEYQDAFVVVTDKKISSIAGPQDKIVAMLECMANSGKPFIIIAEDVDGIALNTLVLNKLKGGIKLCAVKAPGLGQKRKDYLEEIALITGATLISDSVGTDFDVFKGGNVNAAGKVSQLIVTKDKTTLVGGSGDQTKIDEAINNINARLDNTTDEKEIKSLKERKGRLIGRVATIYVGAESEVAKNELHDLVEDSLNATKAAMEEGIIPGGGAALVHASVELEKLPESMVMNTDEKLGYGIVMTAIKLPFYTIMDNAGLKAEVLLNEIEERDYSFGVNALKAEIVDMYVEGVIDPIKVTRMALLDAVSVVSTLITTSVTIFNKVEKKKSDD